jgi:LemA protein
VALLSLGLASCGINTIPTLEEQAKADWSQVQNQYQRRADLIPNLVETVKGYAEQEREVLTAVVEARAKATSITITADDLSNPELVERYRAAQAELSRSLGRLLATVEAYPDLKSNQNFLTLQAQLEGTENRIAVARRDYIEAVRRYNTELKTFPGRLWAATLYAGYEPMATFEADETAATPPRVDFGRPSSQTLPTAPAPSGAGEDGAQPPAPSPADGATAPATAN